MPEPRIIKKYSNRRMYDPASSRYVNLEEVAALIREGEEIQVQDAKTGEDLTRHVLTQIIVEESRDAGAGPPLDFLRDLVRATDRAHRDFLHWYLSHAAEAYEKMERVWRGSWPSTRPEPWAKMWDPLAAFRRPSESAAGGGSARARSRSAETRREVEELRRRIDELEARLAEE